MLCLEDTSRTLPKRDTWTLDNQRRLVVPDWTCALECLSEGLCVGMMPVHRVSHQIEQQKLQVLALKNTFSDSPCCLTWDQSNSSPSLAWLLEYMGDTETMNQEWLRD